MLINLIPVVGIILSYFSVQVSPASFWPLAIIGLAYPFLLLANLLFILLWLFFKPRYALLSFFAIFVGFNHLSDYIQLKGKQTDQEGIHFFSYNVRNFYGTNASEIDKVADRIYQHLTTKKPDIVCLQEASLKWQNRFPKKQKGKKSSVPFFRNMHWVKNGGPITYSSFPIIQKNELFFENSNNMIIISDLKINEDTVRLFNCHLQSYKLSDADISSLDSLSFNNQDKSLRDMRNVGGKMKRAMIMRAKQTDKLSEQINQSPYPVIVCGDFNEAPVSYTYRKVRGNLKDAFIQSGSGLGNTYLGNLPSFRIDYILHSPEYESFNFQVDKIEESDHYPISCLLVKMQDQ